MEQTARSAAFRKALEEAANLPESGVTATVGGVPFIFLAIIVLGFCTWEGGLFGIQEPHREFARFDDALARDQHLLIVDVTASEERILERIMAHYSAITPAGEGNAAPELVVQAHRKFNSAMQTLP